MWTALALDQVAETLLEGLDGGWLHLGKCSITSRKPAQHRRDALGTGTRRSGDQGGVCMEHTRGASVVCLALMVGPEFHSLGSEAPVLWGVTDQPNSSVLSEC